jgi:eukaryotic-like serine/threonine-protein kinase
VNPATLNDQEFLAIDLSYENRLREAEKLFRDAIASADKGKQTEALGTAWYNFACGAAVAGHHEEALQYLARAIDLGYGRADEIAGDDDLKSLRGVCGSRP